MKINKSVIFIAVFVCGTHMAISGAEGPSKGKMFSLSYGDAWADLEDTKVDSSGWRVNALYEVNSKGFNSLVHGFSVGYIETTAEHTANNEKNEFTIRNLPIYYAPKLLAGNQYFKGFVKGALGGHFSEYERKGRVNSTSTTDLGFYGGASLGLMAIIMDKVFINAEYEWSFFSNSYYQDGRIESGMIGLGIKW